jgi:PAS domain S-box-containing protein
MGVRSPLLKAYGDDFAWSLLDAAPDAMLVVSATGEIVFVNDHAGELLGFAVEDLLGLVIEDLLPAAVGAIHRAHRTRYRAEPTVRSMGAGLDLWARRSDGSLFPVEISLSPLTLGDDALTVAAVRDITERVESEDRLHRVLRTLDSSDDGVFIFDATTLRFSFVNEGAVRLTGYTVEQLLTMTPLHLNPYMTEAECRRLVDPLLADETTSELRQEALLRKDGTEVAVENTFRCAPVGRDGNSWVITLVRDISARIEAEAVLRRSRQNLHAAEQAVAIAEDRERIARDLHDTVIQRLFAAGLNLQATAGLVDSRARSRIESTIDGLDQTITDLRTAVFSLQGAGSTPEGLRGRLLAVIADATPGLGFDPRLQFDGPIELIDPKIAEHLLPVMREALSNVARHSRAHSVRVAVLVAADVTLTVSDDGVGVPAEVLGGRGLTNLAERARALGGNCTIASKPCGGALLVWRVPMQL